MSGANTYSVNFSDVVDLVPDDWGYAYYTDASGNQIYTYANAPVTNAWKDFNWVWGYVDPKLSSVSVTLKNASNATRASTSFMPSASGYWGTYLWNGDTRVDIASGDRVEVVPAGGASMNVPVPGLTANLDISGDRIWGSAPANVLLHTYVWRWLGSSYSGYYYRSTASNSAGSYSASPGVDIVTCDYGETWYINPQGNRVYVKGYTNFGDGYEPDNTYTNARMIQTQGQPSANHNFHTAGDHDWFKFYAYRNVRYIIETFNLGYGSDTYLQLYATNGATVLREDDDSGDGLASRIEWTAPASDFYYVKVRHYSPSRVGCDTRYDLKIAGCIAPSGLNVCTLRPGDILLKTGPTVGACGELYRAAFHIGGTYFTHSALYLGVVAAPGGNPNDIRPRIAEAQGKRDNDANEVWETWLADTQFWTGDCVTDWVVVRPATTQDAVAGAISYARQKAAAADVVFDIHASKEDPKRFYCSKLVWRSYLDGSLGGPNLEADRGLGSITFGSYWVTPDDLYHGSPMVQEKEVSPGQKIKRGFFYIWSPGHLTLIDPFGRRTGYNPVTGNAVSEIPNAAYYAPPEAVVETIIAPGMGSGWQLVVTGFATGNYGLESGYANQGTRRQLLLGATYHGKTEIYPVSDPIYITYLPMVLRGR